MLMGCQDNALSGGCLRIIRVDFFSFHCLATCVQVFLKQSLFHLILLVAECVREFAKELGLLTVCKARKMQQ